MSVTCDCEAIILVGKVFRSIILVGSLVPLDARSFWWENLKCSRARSFYDICRSFAPIILVGKINKKTIILVGVHFGGKSLY